MQHFTPSGITNLVTTLTLELDGDRCPQLHGICFLQGASHFDIVGRGRYIEAIVRHRVAVYLSNYNNSSSSQVIPHRHMTLEVASLQCAVMQS